MVWLNGTPRTNMDWDRFNEAVEQIATPSSEELSAEQSPNRSVLRNDHGDCTHADMHAKCSSNSVGGNTRPKWLKQSDSIPFSGSHRHRLSSRQMPSCDAQLRCAKSVCKTIAG